jgi:hypothetical protein
LINGFVFVRNAFFVGDFIGRVCVDMTITWSAKLILEYKEEK